MRFRVLTFVTDASSYAAMRASFERGGFTHENAEFVAVDNTAGNRADPYSVVNDMLARETETWLLVCHQDVRLDQGAGHAELVHSLETAGDAWGVAGPAGISLDYRQVLAISDPWDLPRWRGPWPVPVQSLDELLIVIRPGRAHLTDGLAGFHFYGLDLCLSAARLGWTAIAIDFPLTHLSDGRTGQASAAYRASRLAFQTHVSRSYMFALAVTNTGEGVLLSRWKVVRRLADRPRVHEAIKRRRRRSPPNT